MRVIYPEMLYHKHTYYAPADKCGDSEGHLITIDAVLGEHTSDCSLPGDVKECVAEEFEIEAHEPDLRLLRDTAEAEFASAMSRLRSSEVPWTRGTVGRVMVRHWTPGGGFSNPVPLEGL